MKEESTEARKPTMKNHYGYSIARSFPIGALVYSMGVAGIGTGLVAITGCAISTPVEGQATPEQLRAAARFTVTASQKAAMILHQGGVLDTADFLAGVSAIHAAREALGAVGLAGFDAGDVAKAIAVAKAAWELAQAGYQVANAAKITPEQAALWEEQGIAEDAKFDAYVEGLK